MLRKFVRQKFGDSDGGLKLTANFKADFKLLSEHFLREELPLKPPNFRKDEMIQQGFNLPRPLLEYICRNGNYEVTQKLQYSAKQVYLLTLQTLCFKLSLSELDETEAPNEALFLSTKAPEIPGVQPIFVGNTLCVSSKNPLELSKFRPKIYKCTVQFLWLEFQLLTLEEYHFLTHSKSIKLICFNKTIISNPSGESMAPLESVMENLPNAEYIT